jgi:hypothetical protein
MLYICLCVCVCDLKRSLDSLSLGALNSSITHKWPPLYLILLLLLLVIHYCHRLDKPCIVHLDLWFGRFQLPTSHSSYTQIYLHDFELIRKLCGGAIPIEDIIPIQTTKPWMRLYLLSIQSSRSQSLDWIPLQQLLPPSSSTSSSHRNHTLLISCHRMAQIIGIIHNVKQIELKYLKLDKEYTRLHSNTENWTLWHVYPYI